jgi:MoaA/NifB/PqqE/SkfB family radical SAM enzyme
MPAKSMNVARNLLRKGTGVMLRSHPKLRDASVRLETALLRHEQMIAGSIPALIQPRPHLIMFAVTSHCNLRCQGCRYGRDFMPGSQLSWEHMKLALDDAKEAGIYKVRLYGGEPLLHPRLADMVAHCRSLGMVPGVTTNAVALASKIDSLYEAGLRDISIGFYGTGDSYDAYTQRPGRARKMEEGIAAVRTKYGDQVHMQINWLLRRQTCDLTSLMDAVDFALKYNTTLQVDLVHYSLPYFTEGPDRFLQFRPEDRQQINIVIERLLELKAKYPEMIRHTPEAIRSMPDWLLLGPGMKVPCNARDMIWVGADGTVQLCYVTFKLGNLNEKRLRDMLFSDEHVAASRDAFALRCPNCHCSAGERIMRDTTSFRKYGET